MDHPNPKVRIVHSMNPEISCGIGMIGLNGPDPQKLVSDLQAKYGIFAALMPHEAYLGIRITPSVYTTLAVVDHFSSAVEKELHNS